MHQRTAIQVLDSRELASNDSGILASSHRARRSDLPVRKLEGIRDEDSEEE